MRSTNPLGRNPFGRRGWQREQRDDLGLPEVIYVLWTRRRLVAVVVLTLLTAAVVLGALGERVYTAEAVVRVVPQQEISPENLEPFVQEVQGAVDTEDLLRDVRRETGWSGERREFRDRFDVEPFVMGEGQAGLRIGFSGNGREEAARAANAYAALFVERVERLNDQRLAGGALAADARLERRASPPESSAGPGPLLYALGAVAAGILLGGAVALLLEGRTNSWRDARDAELTLRAPVLGVIPEYPASSRPPGGYTPGGYTPGGDPSGEGV